MQKTTVHNNIFVRCSMDEPIELLINKLSTRSTDLFIFWQNYNQMYMQYNQKINENRKLKQQIQYLRNQLNQPKQIEIRTIEDPHLKEKLRNLQSNIQASKLQTQQYKIIATQLKIQNTKLIQQITQMTLLIAQLRQENNQQKISISNIIQKLKNTQNQITEYEKLYEQVQQKDIIIAGLVEKQKDLQLLIQQKDDEIEELRKVFKDTKTKYQKVIKETMQNVKQNVMNSMASNFRMTGEKIGVDV